MHDDEEPMAKLFPEMQQSQAVSCVHREHRICPSQQLAP